MEHSQIQNLKAFMRGRNYSQFTIQKYCKSLGNFPNGLYKLETNFLFEHIKKSKTNFSKNHSDSLIGNHNAVANLYFLMLTGKTFRTYAKSIKKQKSYDEILEEFYIYSIEFKKLNILTVKSECEHIGSFLECIGYKTFNDILNICANDVRNYVCKSLNHLQPSSKGRYITSLRNFFRFMEYKGIMINTSVLNLPLSPAVWNKGNIPTILTSEEEKRLRSFHQKNNNRSNRNHVIVTIFLDLGLRCSEVAELRLSDIKWNEGTILIQNTKTKRNRKLPIEKELGKILEEYIIKYKPTSLDNHLFLRCSGSSNGKLMSRAGIRSVIRYAFKKQGITGRWKGTHALRRTVASRIYNSGCGLKLTADILGHISIDSTKEYVKVDFNSLSKVDTHWPNGGLNDNFK
jgi:site-specific recombinase XerD